MATELSDIEMISKPGAWPRWPLLPMKRSDGSTRAEVGLITPDYPHIVIHAGLYEIDPTQLVLHQLANDGKVTREGKDITTVYTDVQAMLDDGWMVD